MLQTAPQTIRHTEMLLNPPMISSSPLDSSASGLAREELYRAGRVQQMPLCYCIMQRPGKSKQVTYSSLKAHVNFRHVATPNQTKSKSNPNPSQTKITCSFQENLYAQFVHKVANSPQ
jgi:tRNA A37 threonylcarbamoyltransferase TsaD